MIHGTTKDNKQRGKKIADLTTKEIALDEKFTNSTVNELQEKIIKQQEEIKKYNEKIDELNNNVEALFSYIKTGKITNTKVF